MLNINKVKIVYLIIFNILLFEANIFCKDFVQKLLNENDSIIYCIDEQEIYLANRLGIQYQNIGHKYLIGFDIDPSLKQQINKYDLEYSIDPVDLDSTFSKLAFSTNDGKYKKEFYFKNDKYISPISYYTRNWIVKESNHFRFLISDSMLFNKYCMDNLENFFTKISTTLNFTTEEINRIKREKIYYILCRDEKEIEKLTGFQARGIYILAYDFIISTYNAHYHELLHLLINYKLKNLPLYTHPFFQEGFAVAFGGRGGKEPDVILNVGNFLAKSKILDYQDLFTKSSFYAFDVSMSYPLSGLYNRFLMDNLDINQYFKLYIKYSGTSAQVQNMNIRISGLLPDSAWQEFLKNQIYNPIDIQQGTTERIVVHDYKDTKIYSDSVYYYFSISDTLLILTENSPREYKSKKFYEIYHNRKYNGEKYLVLANESEVAIYNLWTNNLIANIVSSFCLPFAPIQKINGYFQFRVKKKLFDEDLRRTSLFIN